ncbi:glycine receptor subunit alpha-2-like [Argiope bruennichi]|uniref:glycine receptor subunit alpha-2-like n=1 Tax=Argiope bruennichi TaxID=94029 RepID=UPI002493F2C6|nr:glycine receptor subunit alpha-2-like [Argiope bruennichi]
MSEKSIIINAKEVKRMWLPDTYIGNSKVVETPAKDSSTSFIIVKSVGQQCFVEYTLRLAAILSCQMDFKHYPVDVQVCPFNLRSFSYPKEMVVYLWDQDGPPPVNPEMRMLRHRVAISKGKSEIHMLNKLRANLLYYHPKIFSIIVTYSTLYVNLTFERDLAHHLIQVFTPSALIVMLSWLSFWLGSDATAGRITLCVTSLLALITQFSSIRRDLPPLSYIHRVDIWMVTCMCFVFASLLEFTILIYIDKQQERKESKRNTEALSLESNNHVRFSSLKLVPPNQLQTSWQELSVRKRSFYGSPDFPASPVQPIHTCRDWAHTIDKSSRFLFPLAFLLFNTFYWPILLSR